MDNVEQFSNVSFLPNDSPGNTFYSCEKFKTIFFTELFKIPYCECHHVARFLKFIFQRVKITKNKFVRVGLYKLSIFIL